MIILDTNVTSELMMAQPDQAVIGWFAEQPSAELFSTVITIAEISYGLERLPRGQRRKSLEQSYESIFMAMADHIVPFDVEAALLSARLSQARSGPALPWTLWTHRSLASRQVAGR